MRNQIYRTLFVLACTGFFLVATSSAQPRKERVKKDDDPPRKANRVERDDGRKDTRDRQDTRDRKDTHDRRDARDRDDRRTTTRSYTPRSRYYRPGQGSIRYSERHGSDRRYVDYGPRQKHLRDVRVVQYPRRGTVIRHLPHEHRVVEYHGHRYYQSDGIFYLSVRIGDSFHFEVARPPLGAAVTVLPADYQVVYYHDRPYYYYDDVYYEDVIVDGRPQILVVEPPIGATIVSLPPQYSTVLVQNRRYYRVENHYYEPRMLSGSVVYRRVSVDFGH